MWNVDKHRDLGKIEKKVNSRTNSPGQFKMIKYIFSELFKHIRNWYSRNTNYEHYPWYLSDFKESDLCIEQGLPAHVLFHGCSAAWVALANSFPLHNQDKMSTKEDKCVLCLFLQHSKLVWKLVLNSALLEPVFEWGTLLEKECSSLHLMFDRFSSGRCSQASRYASYQNHVVLGI